MAFTLVSDIFAKIDSVARVFINDVSTRVVAEITPVVSVGLTLMFIVFGMLVIRGAVEMPLMDFLGKSIRTGIICAVALGAGLYQGPIADAIIQTPEALASSLVPNQAAGSTTTSLIDQAAGTGFDRASEAFSHANLYSGDGIVFSVFGLLLLLATTLTVFIGAAILIVAKVCLAMLVGLGPLLIAALLFEPTKRLFDAWVSQLLNYALIIVLFGTVFAFLGSIFGAYSGAIKMDGSQNLTYAIGGALGLSVVSVMMMFKLPELATALASGVSMSMESRAMRGLASAGKGAMGQRQITNDKGHVTQKGGGMIGAAQMMGRGAGKIYGYAQGKMGGSKAA